MIIKEIDFHWDPSLPVFASPFFLKTTGSIKFGWVGGFINGKLTFVLPFFIKRKLIFRYIGFATDTIILEEEQKNLEKDYLNSVVKYFKTQKIDFIAQPQTNVVFNDIPDSSIKVPFGTYQIDLTIGVDQLWKNIHSKHRNVIRNAENNAIKIERGIQFKDQAYLIIKETLERSSMNFLAKYNYEHFLSRMDKNIEIFIAFHNEIPQCAAIIPYSEFSAYYLWAGSYQNMILGSMNLLIWKAIIHFAEKKIRKFDFFGARIKPEEGSRLEGIQRFKQRFGSVIRIGYIWKYIYHPVKYWLFNFLVRIKSNQFINYKGDVIDQEISLL